jgi:hypothetical protein
MLRPTLRLTSIGLTGERLSGVNVFDPLGGTRVVVPHNVALTMSRPLSSFLAAT